LVEVLSQILEFAEELPKKLKYYFRDEKYVRLLYDLCHVYSAGKLPRNHPANRLEWVGDKLLAVVVAEWLDDLADEGHTQLDICGMCFEFDCYLNFHSL
jgi:hypothetical protein